MRLSLRIGQRIGIAVWIGSYSALAWSAAGKLPEGLDQLTCRSQLETVLKGWDTQDDWRRAVDPTPGGKAYRSPTSHFGAWVEVHSSAEGGVEAFRISNSALVHLAWDAKTCEPYFEAKPVVTPKQNVFTDEDLSKLLKSGKPGAIYVWNPGFDLSYASFADFKKSAEKHGLQITVVLAGNVDPKYLAARDRLSKVKLPSRRLESVEIYNRDMALHFPNTIVYANGRLARINSIGGHEQPAFDRYFDTELAALKGGH